MNTASFREGARVTLEYAVRVGSQEVRWERVAGIVVRGGRIRLDEPDPNGDGSHEVTLDAEYCTDPRGAVPGATWAPSIRDLALETPSGSAPDLDASEQVVRDGLHPASEPRERLAARDALSAIVAEVSRLRAEVVRVEHERDALRASVADLRALLEEPERAARNRIECEEARQRGAEEERGRCFDLVAHLHRQRAWSERTFGQGYHVARVLDHIRKELGEIEREPCDLTEWIDVVLLACDGAWRAGHEPEAIAAALAAKQARNESRQWPDWRTVAPGKAIEHVRNTPAKGDGSTP